MDAHAFLHNKTRTEHKRGNKESMSIPKRTDKHEGAHGVGMAIVKVAVVVVVDSKKGK